jgi:hypothetical protein
MLECVGFVNPKGNGRGNGGRGTAGRRGTGLAASTEEGGARGEPAALDAAAAGEAATLGWLGLDEEEMGCWA